MTETKDFIAFNIPGILSTKVVIRDRSDPSISRRDDGWYDRTKIKFRALIDFFVTRGLLRYPENLPAVEQVVLRLSDFTAVGQEFVRSGAVDRWLSSFDRPGSKKELTDTGYLDKRLAKIQVS